jgi:hypothetical protein
LSLINIIHRVIHSYEHLPTILSPILAKPSKTLVNKVF